MPAKRGYGVGLKENAELRYRMPRDVSSLVHPPAENLQHSQVKTKSAYRTKPKGSTWLMSTWNVRSLLDCEGPVETVKQGTKTEQSDYR